jgi:hypothetical protein
LILHRFGFFFFFFPLRRYRDSNLPQSRENKRLQIDSFLKIPPSKEIGDRRSPAWAALIGYVGRGHSGQILFDGGGAGGGRRPAPCGQLLLSSVICPPVGVGEPGIQKARDAGGKTGATLERRRIAPLHGLESVDMRNGYARGIFILYRPIDPYAFARAYVCGDVRVYARKWSGWPLGS